MENEKLIEIANRIREEKISKNKLYIKGKNKPLFVDVETTGLHSDDQIVSICMILLYADKSQELQKLTYKSLYYIFDPCKKSHPIAEGIHGYNDWTLRHQNLFEEKMEHILSFIEESDVIVAHNVNFDMKFIRNSFANAKIDIGKIGTMCTMEMHGGSLSACSKRLGIQRKTSIHDAAEDVLMCMCLYLEKMSNINVLDMYHSFTLPKLKNFIEPPPVPDGKLPRRNNIKKRNEILGEKFIK
ncbi:3'-5' exonuclease [Acetobacter pasteurianus]|uniref:3'-5' exonuclease n=1 Tax=Acetobacter pasteurianus TaxID=438 RepID=UPI00216ACB56|nr:3'-5' exonuclease [Acetobacter pasteurianus]